MNQFCFSGDGVADTVEERFGNKWRDWGPRISEIPSVFIVHDCGFRKVSVLCHLVEFWCGCFWPEIFPKFLMHVEILTEIAANTW